MHIHIPSELPCKLVLLASSRPIHATGTEFGGPNGYFTIDAADGVDNSCFKAALAGMFKQTLCSYKTVTGGIECVPQPDGTHCICLAPFGQPAVVVNKRKWAGNIAFNTFLKFIRTRAGLVDDPSEKVYNKVKMEMALLRYLNVTDCEPLV
jgi:hypothetical protein